ncbi:MAG: GIY-YIG nuclease family protein [bacterium]
MFYLYILKSQLNLSFYIGSCHDIKKRIKLHNQGLVKSTKRYIPWNIIYIESYNDLKSAKKRELQIKSWKKRSAIERLIKH